MARTSKKERKRPPPRQPWMRAFLDALSRTGNVLLACRAAKVGRSTAYDHRKRNPAFAVTRRSRQGSCERRCRFRPSPKPRSDPIGWQDNLWHGEAIGCRLNKLSPVRPRTEDSACLTKSNELLFVDTVQVRNLVDQHRATADLQIWIGEFSRFRLDSFEDKVYADNKFPCVLRADDVYLLGPSQDVRLAQIGATEGLRFSPSKKIIKEYLSEVN